MRMTKFGLLLLNTMKQAGAVTAGESLTISQMLEKMPDEKKKPYYTIYRHLLKMCDAEYVKRGLDDGLGNTYYLTDAGIAFIDEQN